MVAAFTSPNSNSTYIKDWEASGRLAVGYSRNPKKFRASKYIQIKEVNKQSGYYLQIDQYVAMNLVGGDIDSFVWTDGMPRPILNNSKQRFRWLPFQTVRRNFGDRNGKLAIDQAEFDLSGLTQAAQAQLAMTARTRQIHKALALSGNWDASHRVDVTTIPGGGQWSAALSTTPFIRKACNYAVNQIMLDTGSKLEEEDLNLVINPRTAYTISQTQELLDFVKQSPDALDQIRTRTGKWSRFGLPDRLFGLDVVVEDAVMDTAAKGIATRTPTYVMPDAVAYILARPGGIEAPAGGPSFSTVTFMAYEEMTVERNVDTWNRLEDDAVVDNGVAVVTSPVSGFSLLNLY